MKEWLQHIPQPLVQFVMVTVFSLLIGLEQRRLQLDKAEKQTFGTDRTFAFIGIFGYLLFIFDPEGLLPYLLGGGGLVVFLAIFYFEKIRKDNLFGLTKVMIALLTYCLAPLVVTQPYWFTLLVVVVILVFTESKAFFSGITDKLESDEFTTLAKFMVMAGVILPILPDEAIFPEIDITPRKIWLAVVAISGVSYASYLVKKFIFPKSGLLISGILGGIYSSTVTTLVLGRRSKESGGEKREFAGAILLATAAMYARIQLLVLIFNTSLALRLMPHLILLAILSAVVAIVSGGFFKKHEGETGNDSVDSTPRNPLEIRISIIFALVFVAFSAATHFTLQYAGISGLDLLSLFVGVADIDPFLLNIFQGTFAIPEKALVLAVLQAITSNNLLKLFYARATSDKATRKWVTSGFLIIIVAGLLDVLLLRLI
jgi:uncharacterized membrane protein (DUF4010 family)